MNTVLYFIFVFIKNVWCTEVFRAVPACSVVFLLFTDGVLTMSLA